MPFFWDRHAMSSSSTSVEFKMTELSLVFWHSALRLPCA